MSSCCKVFSFLGIFSAALGILSGVVSFSSLSLWARRSPGTATIKHSSQDNSKEHTLPRPFVLEATRRAITTTSSTTQWLASWHDHDLNGMLLSSAKCSELMDDTSGNFYAIWHFVGYSFIKLSEQACWVWRWWSPNREQQFFEDALTGAVCDRNWNSGHRGGYWDRNVYQNPAPALLGEDRYILDACCEASGTKGADCDESYKANICYAASYNILNVINATNPWNMCQNFVWQLCAVLGKLPGQTTTNMHFNPAPKNYPLTWWTQGASLAEANFNNYAVSFAEVCILNEICSNRDQLFSIDAMEPYRCELDVQRYRNLAAALIRSSNPAGVSIREMGV